ncbi:fructose-6-phosphate aldolase, partial [candidate division KSB1 bacterium]|nr:fructose-6-phosphate aldolase [candidate division KSB1 bacterium]
MKIFLDTANIDAIRKATRSGLIDGVTTNPTHILKSGGNFRDIV